MRIRLRGNTFEEELELESSAMYFRTGRTVTHIILVVRHCQASIEKGDVVSLTEAGNSVI